MTQSTTSYIPYTTLFRSPAGERGGGHVQRLAAALGLVLACGDLDDQSACGHGRTLTGTGSVRKCARRRAARPGAAKAPATRSEEHTSELQSPDQLVFRLP